jgi:hypothetical protein
MSAFEQGWRALKIAVYAVGALFVLVLALGFYFRKDPPAKAPVAVRTPVPAAAPVPAVPKPEPQPSIPVPSVSPPGIAKAAPPAGPSLIERLDRADYRNLAKVLSDGVLHATPDEAEQAVQWLMPRRFRGEVPYLYFLGMYLGKQEGTAKKTEGLEYILTGAVVYRIDAVKCGDPTANQAVTALESAIGVEKLRESLRQRPAFRKLVIAKALLNEIQSGPRPRPDWICRHGLRTGTAPDEKEFEKRREEIARQFVEKY